MAKVFASQTAMDVATEAVQVHGGYGFVKNITVERMMRDAKINSDLRRNYEVQKKICNFSVQFEIIRLL